MLIGTCNAMVCSFHDVVRHATVVKALLDHVIATALSSSPTFTRAAGHVTQHGNAGDAGCDRTGTAARAAQAALATDATAKMLAIEGVPPMTSSCGGRGPFTAVPLPRITPF